jgi:hypothetical protein
MLRTQHHYAGPQSSAAASQTADETNLEAASFSPEIRPAAPPPKSPAPAARSHGRRRTRPRPPARAGARCRVVRVAASPGCRQACRARRCRAPGWGSSALGSRDLGGGLAASACQPSSSCAATTTHQHLPRASTATYPTFMSCLHSWSWRRVDQHQLGDGVSDFFSVENPLSTRRTWNVLVSLG